MPDQTPIGDEELVRAAQGGALEAFAALYERYLPRVYKRVRCVIPEDDVEDVTQEIFIAAMKSLKSFRFEACFSTWLRTLVNRQVADYYRKRKAKEVSLEGIIDSGHRQLSMLGSDDNTQTLEESIVVRRALRRLPEHYQEVILLRFADGLQFSEIAQVRGQSLEAIKSLYRRAIVALNQEVNTGDS
ncbi:MAG: sigma-70 family RNA polymerase sigma factor [Anaerolineales bacterium]|nr:sigma-70 family RNA polymerase sigma factor [Anaerolineales bacterium]